MLSKTKYRIYSFKRWLTAATLPRYGYDGIAPDAPGIARLFPHASFVCGYDTGGWVWSAQAWALFPNAVRIHIVTYAGANEGDVLDVENGDATPAQTEGWIRARKAAGYHRPTIYCSAATVPAVRAGTGPYVLNVDYDLWVAHWTGSPHQEFSNGKPCAVTQYESTNAADYNVCYDPAWPHRSVVVPPKPTPVPVPVPVPPAPPVVVPMKRVVATGSVSLAEAARFYGVTELEIIDCSLAEETPANKAKLLQYLMATSGNMPKGLVYWVPSHNS